MIILSIAIFSLLLSSCSFVSAASTVSATPSLTVFGPPVEMSLATPQKTVVPTSAALPDVIFENFPVDVDPLTGLQVADPTILDRRPVAVKISNFPRTNRPQWGLSLADIVYEYYHNNDLTRFYAIFYGQNADMAGPIRSGRLFDSYLTDIYQDIIAFASADPRVLVRLNSEHPAWQLVPLLDGECPPRPVCRFEPETNNFLVANTAAVGGYALARGGENQRPDLHGMAFGANTPEGGQPVTQVNVYYSYSAYSYWEYDSDLRRYLRFEDTREDLGSREEVYAPLMDRLTNQQVATDNVVVLYVDHFHYFYRPATDIVPAVEIVDMNFTGRGPAYAFRDGQAYSLGWVREEGQLLYLVDSNGQRYPFKPGTTWFEVINDDSRLTIDEAAWRFEFIFRRP